MNVLFWRFVPCTPGVHVILYSHFKERILNLKEKRYLELTGANINNLTLRCAIKLLIFHIIKSSDYGQKI